MKQNFYSSVVLATVLCQNMMNLDSVNAFDPIAAQDGVSLEYPDIFASVDTVTDANTLTGLSSES